MITPAVPTSVVSRNSAAADELRLFLQEALPAFQAEWGDDRGHQARLAWQRRLHAGGWVAPGWSIENGGRGLGVADRVACDLVLAELRAPTVAGVLGVNNVGPTLAAVGNDEQKLSLPRILSGEEIWCQGFSEPEAGSDLAGLRCQARLEGDTFIVNGQKVWTSQGVEATHCQLLVRTDNEAAKHKGISALAIPLDLPGIERRPLRQISGEADFAEVFFQDVRVPVSCLLGPLHQGWAVTMTTLAHERAGVIMVAAHLEAEVTQLLASRRVDSAAEPTPPVLRDELLQRYVDARVLGLMGADSLALAESGGTPGPAQSVIKLSWSLRSQELAATRLALAGLDAVCGTTPDAARSYLGARATTIAGGTTEVMKNILAERVLGMPKGA